MSKPKLILIPGLLCDSALWSRLLEPLDAYCDLSITDQHRRHDSIDEIAEAIALEAPTRFCIAGLSMGGYIALELALRFPQRVQGLALLSTSARADSAEQTQLRLQQMALAQTNRFEQVIEHLLPRFLHPDHLRDDCLTGQIRQMCQRVGARDYLRQQQAIIGRRDQRAQLARIDCPTLVICGEQDQLTPMHLSEEMHAALPGSRLLRLADCGHLSALERPEACARALLEWLQLCEQNALTA